MDAATAFLLGHPFWPWIGVAAIFLVGELMTGSGWLLWPAGAAAVVAVINLFVRPGGVYNVLIFAGVAIVATYVGRRFMPPAPAHDHNINDAADRLVGHQGETTSPFRDGQGRVFVDGKEWAAELDGDADLPARAKIKVVALIGGARLKVKAA